MRARFATKCKKCGYYIRPCDSIRVAGRRQSVHENCTIARLAARPIKYEIRDTCFMCAAWAVLVTPVEIAGRQRPLCATCARKINEETGRKLESCERSGTR